MCKISIIVPIYNGEKTLNRCLDSILKQSFSDFELLLINDGSTDDSLQICKMYVQKDQRIRLFSQKNRGASAARNLGLANIRGKWVTFCDADDYVDKHWLSLFVENIKNNDLVIQGLIPHRNSVDWNAFMSYDGDTKNGLVALFQNQIVGYLVVKLFKSDIIKNNHLLFNETFKFREDEDFVLKYLRYVSKIKSVSEGAYHYIMPDLSSKYLSGDTFYCSLSMYLSVSQILGVEHSITRKYLLELTNSLFDSYARRKKNSKQKLLLYRKYVKTEFYKIKDISILSKFVYLFGSLVAHNFYILKSKIK